MKRILTATLSIAAIAAFASPAAALSGRHAEEFHEGLGNKLSGRHAEEFREGLGNKLSGRHAEEFHEGLGNKLSGRFEEEFERGLGNNMKSACRVIIGGVASNLAYGTPTSDQRICPC